MALLYNGHLDETSYLYGKACRAQRGSRAFLRVRVFMSCVSVCVIVVRCPQYHDIMHDLY